MSIIGSVISGPETQKPRQRYSVFFFCFFFLVCNCVMPLPSYGLFLEVKIEESLLVGKIVKINLNLLRV